MQSTASQSKREGHERALSPDIGEPARIVRGRQKPSAEEVKQIARVAAVADGDDLFKALDEIEAVLGAEARAIDVDLEALPLEGHIQRSAAGAYLSPLPAAAQVCLPHHAQKQVPGLLQREHVEQHGH